MGVSPFFKNLCEFSQARNLNIKIPFFWCIYYYQDSDSYSFGYYWATSLRTHSSLPRTIRFTRSNKNTYGFAQPFCC